MDKRFVDFYMDVAARTSQMSRAVRLQVGAIVVKDDKIISLGYNGTPKGWDNACEDKEWMNPDAGGWLDSDEINEKWPHIATSDPDGYYIGRYRLKTKPEVLHAERNALDKLAKGAESGVDSTMFITHAPCLECAKSIYGAGIKEVYYSKDYRDPAGVQFLKKCGVLVKRVETNE